MKKEDVTAGDIRWALCSKLCSDCASDSQGLGSWKTPENCKGCLADDAVTRAYWLQGSRYVTENMRNVEMIL